MLDTLFAADSPLMRVLSRLADVVVLNLLFVVTSLPLVTLGASLTGLHYTGMRLVRGRCESVTSDYLRAFRENFRQGTLLLLALLGLAAVLGAWYAVVTVFVASATAQLLAFVVWFVAAIQLVLTALFAFPYLATIEDPLPRVLRNAWLMSIRHPLAAFTVATLVGLPAVITIFYPRTTVYGLLWFVLGFAAVATLVDIVLVRVFDRYLPTPHPTPTPAPQDGAAGALA